MSRKFTSHSKILNDTLDLMTLMTHVTLDTSVKKLKDSRII